MGKNNGKKVSKLTFTIYNLQFTVYKHTQKWTEIKQYTVLARSIPMHKWAKKNT